MTPAYCSIVIAVVIAVNVVVMGFYAGLSTATARFFKIERRMQLVNRVAGGTMNGAGALIVSR